jgi:hypothetical protein
MKLKRVNYIKRINEIENAKKVLNEEGILSTEQLVKTEEKIKNIINEKLLPKIKKHLSKEMKKLNMNLTLLIDYIPKKKFDVSITRKIKIDKKNIISTVSLFETSNSYLNAKKIHKKNPKTILKVTLEDGTVFQERKAKETFAKVIEHIGVNSVKQLNLYLSGKPLISKEVKNNQNYYTRLNNEYYICTHSSTNEKKKILNEISKKLNIGMNIEII